MFRRLRGITGDDDEVEQVVDVSNLDPNDVLLFSDPQAVEKYRREGRLDELKHDIQYSVMRGKPWLQEELEYKAEILRLLEEGIIVPKGAWWWSSPHPPVYRSQKKGRIRIGGKVYKFGKNYDITFQCQMERESRGLTAPLLIGRFNPTNKTELCGKMSGSMKGM